MLKPLAAFAILLLPAAALAEGGGNSVLGMCAGLASQEACECAAEKFRAEVEAEDYALYEGVGADYLARIEGGEGRAAAWTHAVEAAAAQAGQSDTVLMGRTNDIGSVHRAAVEACSG